MHVKTNDLTFDEVNAKMIYDPKTGEFIWRIKPSRQYKAGDMAGSWKSLRKKRYLYITIDGVQTPAARVAWLLTYGEWPNGSVLFRDGDSENLKIDNLKLAAFPSDKIMKDDRRIYRMTPEAARHYGLKRYYGMTGEEYGEMLAAQKGLCAICGKPETAMFKGTPKVMHVDHCHETNQVRALLCGCCNGMLGLAKDNPETLRAAADYVEKHAKVESRVVPFNGRKGLPQ